MVVDGPEIKLCAEAREITGIGRGVNALALKQGKADHKGIQGEGGVHVQVAEEDFFSGPGPRISYAPELRRCIQGGTLPRTSFFYGFHRNRPLCDLPSFLAGAEPSPPDPVDSQPTDEKQGQQEP
jgi:hypothetical protein